MFKISVEKNETELKELNLDSPHKLSNQKRSGRKSLASMRVDVSSASAGKRVRKKRKTEDDSSESGEFFYLHNN